MSEDLDDDEIFTDQPDIWKLIDPVGQAGRPVAYEPAALWAKACEYFEWAKASMLQEEKVFGTGLRAEVRHAKPFTRQGLSVFLGVTPKTLDNYEQRAEYELVMSTIRSIMFDQKFSAAAAGLMNSNLIARELGLAERVRQEASVQDMTDDQIEERFNELLAKEAAARRVDQLH